MKRESPGRGGFLRLDLVVELKHVDLAESQAFETPFEGPLDRAGEVLALLGQDKHLGRDERGGGELSPRLTNDLFRLACAIHWSQIEYVDSTGHCVFHGLDTLLIGGGTP